MILVGSALIAVPLGFALSPAATLVGVSAGVLTLGLGIAGTGTQGRGTLPVSVQAVYDRLLAVGLLLTAIGFGVVDQNAALALFGGAGLATLLTTVTTRYVAPAT
jgi:hypothetical protein